MELHSTLFSQLQHNDIRIFFVSQANNEKSSYNLSMSIGQNIRGLRKERGMSQAALAKLLFTSQDTISLWELDKSLPDILSLIKLTEIFGVTSDYILGIEK